MTPQRKKEIEILLQSIHLEVVLDTLDLIKKEGNVELIGPMVNLMNETDNQEVINAVAEVLRNIKDSNAVPKLLEALENPNSFGNRSVLVAACWESGLNFDEHLSFFVDLAIRDNYLVCLECLTLIENMGNEISERELLTNLAKIKQNIEPGEDKKDELLVALAAVLESRKDTALKN